MNIQEASKPKIPIKFAKAVETRLNNGVSSYDLEKAGWYGVGGGSYCNVWGNPKKNYVLKLTYNPDPAYAYYVSLIKKLHNNHLPIISDLKRIKVNGKNCYIYLIEKLNKADEGWPVADGLNTIMQCPNTKLDELFQYATYFQKTYFKKNSEIVKLARLLGKYKNKSGIRNIFLDMHSGNIMQRNDGTIVITDPYASY